MKSLYVFKQVERHSYHQQNYSQTWSDEGQEHAAVQVGFLRGVESKAKETKRPRLNDRVKTKANFSSENFKTGTERRLVL